MIKDIKIHKYIGSHVELKIDSLHDELRGIWLVKRMPGSNFSEDINQLLEQKTFEALKAIAAKHSLSCIAKF